MGYIIAERCKAHRERQKGILPCLIFSICSRRTRTTLQVTRETIIGDILDMDQSTAPYFMEIGMHCLGCPASRGESIEEACEVHGVDCDELLEKLNAHLASKKS